MTFQIETTKPYDPGLLKGITISTEKLGNGYADTIVLEFNSEAAYRLISGDLKIFMKWNENGDRITLLSPITQSVGEIKRGRQK